MNRRGFLGSLLGAMVAPKALLEVAKRAERNPTWMGIQRATYKKFSETDVIANELARVYDRIPSLFDRDDVFYSAINKPHSQSARRDMRVGLAARPGRRMS